MGGGGEEGNTIEKMHTGSSGEGPQNVTTGQVEMTGRHFGSKDLI